MAVPFSSCDASVSGLSFHLTSGFDIYSMYTSTISLQVETGSSITWKYPSCVLKGDNSVGEFYSVALTNNAQQADTGSKMVHIGKNTRSKIVSKGISAGQSRNAYRGLVQVLIAPASAQRAVLPRCDHCCKHVNIGCLHSTI